MATKHVRIDMEAVDAFRATILPVTLPDAAAANAAVRVAAELPQRERDAMRYGMIRMLDLVRNGHVPADPDVEVAVEGAELVIRKGAQHVATIVPSTRVVLS